MQPQMDRPREVKGTPLSRELTRLLKAGLLITAVVLAVGSLPVLFLWFWADDFEPETTANLAYRDEPIRFQSAGVEIVGRLRMPVFEGPHPVMVVAHGSGRATRDGYDDLSESFALNGIGVLTYDKRGVGESGGEYAAIGPDNSAAMLALLAADVVAGADLLKGRDDVRADQIGVLAISQGGWIAPIAAAQSSDIAYMVIISGPTVSVGVEIFYSELTGEVEGQDPALTDGELSARLLEFPGPHGFDPLPVLESIDTPALWILGAADRSIPIPETVANLDRLIAGGKPFAHEVLADVGHGMRDMRTGESAPAFPIAFQWLASNVTAAR